MALALRKYRPNEGVVPTLEIPPMNKVPALLFLVLLQSSPAAATELKSPNGQVVLHFGLTDSGGLRYNVAYRDKPVVTRSRLGLELKELPNLMENFRVTSVDSE